METICREIDKEEAQEVLAIIASNIEKRAIYTNQPERGKGLAEALRSTAQYLRQHEKAIYHQYS